VAVSAQDSAPRAEKQAAPVLHRKTNAHLAAGVVPKLKMEDGELKIENVTST
jgi:hypothetical protein